MHTCGWSIDLVDDDDMIPLVQHFEDQFKEKSFK